MKDALELSYDALVSRATADCLSKLDGTETTEEVQCLVLAASRAAISARNAVADKGDKWPLPKRLETGQIAQTMASTHVICRIATSDTSFAPDYDLLGLYVDDPTDPAHGTYVTDLDHFRRLACALDYSISSKEVEDVLMHLRTMVKRRQREDDPDLICLGNGVFDYRTKELLPHNPSHVFLSKSAVDYDAEAEEPAIEMPDGKIWTPSSWMDGLSDDPEIVHLLWEITSLLLRPNVRANKTVWLYSETGNNGKGTLCEMWRSILGPGNYASIPIADFGKDFMLEPLVHSNAIIVDENDVGTYVDHTANMKAVITNDVLTINRKYKNPVVFRFRGLMVQCLNEYPKIKDKSESFYRRQLVVPMEKCFTGHTRDYIKTDYLHRPEVLRYIVKRALEGSFYEFTEPGACQITMSDYKEFNDPIRQFWHFFEENAGDTWLLYPFTFLYDLYMKWLPKNVPGGSPVSRNRFIPAVVALANASPFFECPAKDRKIRSKDRMAGPERLVGMFGLKGDWGNPSYNGPDEDRATTPAPDRLSTSYRGIVRRQPKD